MFFSFQTAFFRQHGCTTTDANAKYNSRAAQMYREKIRQLASAAMAKYGTDVSLSSALLLDMQHFVLSQVGQLLFNSIFFSCSQMDSVVPLGIPLTRVMLISSWSTHRQEELLKPDSFNSSQVAGCFGSRSSSQFRRILNCIRIEQ